MQSIPKKVQPLACHYFCHIREPILIILNRNVNAKVSNQKCFIFPQSLN